MIRLNRPNAPRGFTNRATIATAALWQAWQSNRPLRIKKGIYNSLSVKRLLRKAQHQKCAYCETINPRAHSVIEHYRPKLGVRQARGEPLLRPHYFWLAYDWNNLLFACDMCNDGGHKQNLFPLEDPSLRASPQSPNAARESPLIVNPYVDDPADFIGWNADVPKAKCQKGRFTIEVFGLDFDSTLVDARREHFAVVKLSVDTAESFDTSDPRRKAIRAVLLRWLEDSAPYSAMTRSSFQDRILRL